MNVREIETPVRLQLHIIIIVWCDCSYGMISLKQIDGFRKGAFTRFNNPNFVTLAQSFDAISYDVKPTEDFRDILQKAKESTNVLSLYRLMTTTREIVYCEMIIVWLDKL